MVKKNIVLFFYFFLLWLSPTISFNLFYINHITDNVEIYHHFFVMTKISICTLLLFYFIDNTLKIKNKIIFIFSISFFWFLIVITLYASSIIGLISWGKIPTFSILIVYLRQLKEIQSVVGFSYLYIISILTVTILMITFLSYLSVKIILKLSLSRNPIFSILFLLVASLYLSRVLFYDIFLNNHNDPLHQVFFNDYLEKQNTNILLSGLNNNSNMQKIQQENLLYSSYLAIKKNNIHSIILITVDALRPDHMGIYGAKRQTTPFLQKMKDAGQAHLVYEARSACAESTCGLLSLLSGKEPQQLLSKNFALPEILGKLGYKRYFILSGDHSNYYGLRDSYGEYDLYWDGTYNPESYVNDDFALLEEIKNLPNANKESNYFFFIHLMSAHGLGKKYPQFTKWEPQQSIYNLSVSLDSNHNEFLNQYDNGVLQADYIVNQVITHLKEKGYIDDTSITLLTADHGEALGEHGIRSHAESLYESVIRLPWVWIGRPIGILDQPVTQADFAPTILKEIDTPIPEHWKGLPLQEGTNHREITFHVQLPLIATIQYNNGLRKKVIMDLKSKEIYTFDLNEDPNEIEKLKNNNKELEKYLVNVSLSFYKDFHK